MIKFILFIVLSVSILFASVEENKSALDVFMFKIGFTSLKNDFEDKKVNINDNSQDIKKLKEDVSFLLQQQIKQKLNSSNTLDDITANSDITVKNIELEEENKKLKDYIKKLEGGYETVYESEEVIIDDKDAKKEYKIAYVDVEISTLRTEAFSDAVISREVKKDDILKIQSCDSFGWCKVFEKNEYIPKYKLYVKEGKL